MFALKHLNDLNINHHNGLVDLHRNVAVNAQEYAKFLEYVEQRGYGDQTVGSFLLKLISLNSMVILVFQFEARNFQRDIPAVEKSIGFTET